MLERAVAGLDCGRAVDPRVPCLPVGRRPELPELAPLGVERIAVDGVVWQCACAVDDAPAYVMRECMWFH